MRAMLTLTVVVLSLTPLVDVRSAQASIQGPCLMSAAEAPAVRGLRLGMTARNW